MNKKTANTLLIAVLLGLLLMRGQGCTPATVGPKSPIDEPGLKVLVIEETDDRAKLTQGQYEALFSTDANSLRSYVLAKGGAFRPLDQHDKPEFLADAWKKLFAEPRRKVPWIQVANPPRYFAGPLPETEDECIALVKKVGE